MGHILIVCRAVFLVLWVMLAIVLLILLGGFINPYFPHILVVKAWWARWLTRAFGFKVTVEGQPKAGAVLNVGNHISWIDPIILTGFKSTSFLVKAEVASWPLVGRMLKMGGTLFIKRGEGQVYQRVNDIAKAMDKGGIIGVYPEATTTDGQDVKSFAPPLFKVITEKNKPIQLVGIFYPKPNGEKGINPIIPYIGNQSFGENIAKIGRQFKAKPVKLKFFDFDALPNEKDSELAIRAHKCLQTWVKSFH